jgi:hypothetical protein
MLTANLYLDIVVIYLPLYAFCAGFLLAALFAAVRRRYAVALLLAGLAALPFVNYHYAYVSAKDEAARARRAEVASWPQIRVTRDNRPRVFLTTYGTDGFVPKTIIALGSFEKAYGVIGDYWYSFERVPGAACDEAGKDERAIRQKYLHDPNPCVTLTKMYNVRMNTPNIAEPHLRLLADREAPSHHETDQTVFASSTLELRLVSKEDNQLVSFWEAPYFRIPVFPPLLLKNGWSTGWFEAEHAPRPDVVHFVLDALSGT